MQLLRARSCSLLLRPAPTRCLRRRLLARATDSSSSSMGDDACVDPHILAVRAFVPSLSDGSSADQHKGQAGKVGVFGGCREYTGAPYFAAASALRVGADLSHVFCARAAAPVIKAYSPELIVHPYLEEAAAEGGAPADAAAAAAGDAAAAAVAAWLPRLDCLALGSGLGRDASLWATAAATMRAARAASLPLVIDGDALGLVAGEPALIQGYPLAVLTPNPYELRRLAAAWLPGDADAAAAAAGEGDGAAAAVQRLADAMGGPVLVRKGRTDIIAAAGAGAPLRVVGGGCPRRCGGQGDVLAGATAAFVCWAAKSARQEPQRQPGALSLAAYAACTVTRRAARAAFGRKLRAMGPVDMIDDLGSAMQWAVPVASDWRIRLM